MVIAIDTTVTENNILYLLSELSIRPFINVIEINQISMNNEEISISSVVMLVLIEIMF